MTLLKKNNLLPTCIKTTFKPIFPPKTFYGPGMCNALSQKTSGLFPWSSMELDDADFVLPSCIFSHLDKRQVNSVPWAPALPKPPPLTLPAFPPAPKWFSCFPAPCPAHQCCCKLWVRERNFCFSWGSLVFLGEEEGAPALHHPAPFGTPKSAAPRCAGHPPTASPWGKVLQTNSRWDIF